MIQLRDVLYLFVLAQVCLLGLTACSEARASSDKSFDEIRKLIEGKTAEQVVRLLGEPDTRQKVFGSDERWIWWNYTFLKGNDHPPEIRGQVVHLEIVFQNPDRSSPEPPSYAEWRIDEPFGVSFKLPSQGG